MLYFAIPVVWVALAAAPASAAGVDEGFGATYLRSALHDNAIVDERRTTASQQQEGTRRGDDLARNQSWRTFLDRADRAFFAARMSTTEVKAKIVEADARVAELRAARNDPDDEGGRADITGDVAFLERAQRAFTAAHMSTTDVQKWLREARESLRR